MKVKLCAEEVEPFSFVAFLLFAWIALTMMMATVAIWVAAEVVIALFNAPARLLRRKGGA